MARNIGDIKTEIKALDLTALYTKYEELFGEPAMEDDKLTNDKTLLAMKITYAIYLQECSAAEETPNKTIEANATKYFEKVFKSPKSASKKAAVDRGPGLIKTIVDVCWDYYSAGQHPTIEELAAIVTAKVPNCYKENPVGRMRVDIRKFNIGEFKYAIASGKIPPADKPFQPGPSAASEKRTRKPKVAEVAEGADALNAS
jgi:hypothetical protein